LHDLKHDRRIPLKNEAAGEKDIPGAIDRLAESIRQNLSVSPDVIKELQAQAFRPSSNSLEALRSYNEGLGLVRQGNNLEALKRFQSAAKHDPEFALAYAKLGQTYATLGYDNEAEQASRKAVDLSSSLPSRERYLIVANHARVVNDNQKAIELYEDMAKVSPEDTDMQFALGGLYENTSAYDKAREHYDNVLQRDPQYIDALLARGRVEIRSGTPSKGLEYFNRAYSLATQLNNQEEGAASLHLTGVAYEALGKPDEALSNFEKSLAIKRRIGQQRGAAASLNEIANIQAQLGKAQAAATSFQEALKIRRDIGDKRGLGATLLDFGNFVDDRGDHDQALKLYTESLQIQRDIGNESLQAICLNNIGSVHFSKGEYEDALTYFQQALQLREKSKISRDIVESVHNVAETSAMMGQYDQAVTQYMRALDLRRGAKDPRGAAIESYSIGTLFDYQGRFGAAINSKQDALKTFRDLKDRTFWMAEILGGYGNALILAGRGDEAKSYLDESLSLAGELKNYGLVAQTLGWQGDAFYYRGDVKSARSYYERALQAATRTNERDKVLLAKVDLAKVSIQEGHAGAALNSLRSLAQQAQQLGLKYIAIECSLHMAEAMTQAKDHSHARQELDRALGQSDKLGLKPLTVRAHYLLATTLRQSGNGAEAQDHYRQVLRLLDTVRKEPGSEKVMERSDVSTMFTDSTRWLQTKS
jgi:tetratricopeptide (TPR) repeat protein